ncbi:MAG TPA: hypothetical protein VN110_02010 [Sphingobium sp.]|nr:hypothetical protein [Sphingobium sp.]
MPGYDRLVRYLHDGAYKTAHGQTMIASRQVTSTEFEANPPDEISKFRETGAPALAEHR